MPDCFCSTFSGAEGFFTLYTLIQDPKIDSGWTSSDGDGLSLLGVSAIVDHFISQLSQLKEDAYQASVADLQFNFFS